jgi:hypothetical protein
MLFTLLGVMLTGCGGDPVQSYCEATCDWAVSCQEGDRPVGDGDALLADCLSATRAIDSSCEKAESGKIDPASKKALESCVSAINTKADAGECDVFTAADPSAVDASSLPTACATQGSDAVAVFEAAYTSTSETGEELCTRFTESYCEASATCILGDFGDSIPQAVKDAMGGEPYDICVDRLQPQTDSCTTNDMYKAEEGLDDTPNTARQAARRCLRELSTLTCEQINGGQLPEECAASFTSTEDSLSFATALFTLAQDFQAAAQ